MQHLIDVVWNAIVGTFGPGAAFFVLFIKELIGRFREMGDGMISGLMVSVKVLFPTVNFTPWQARMDQLNSVVPVGEALALVVVYFAAWALVKTYRLVKSWVPTVSS